jgi:hypothetical protein
MECMQSFNLFAVNNIAVVAPDIVSWGTGAENYWNIDNAILTNSTFNVEGFKNINIYGVDMVGYVASSNFDARAGLINDWGFTLEINGFVPRLGGNISTTNGYGITTSNPQIKTFVLSKYKTNVNFTDPITSVSNIVVKGLFANGTNLQLANNIRLIYQIEFIFYYKFEGENIALL